MNKAQIVDAIKAIKSLRYFKPNQRKWYQDLCDYYKVSPEKAKELGGGGKRSSDRRPDLPSSPTTKAVSGMTLAEIWESKPRNTIEEVFEWQKDAGSWSSFRQCFYHRFDRFDWLLKSLKNNDRYCEYSSGTAPICNWLVGNSKGKVFNLAIADVDCEHRSFGEWRLKENIKRSGLNFTLEAFIVQPTGPLPLQGEFDVISIIESLVLIHNPLEVVKHATEHLKKGGKLWETYTIMDDKRTKEWLSFKQAQEQREKVFEFIKANFKLISGPDPSLPKDAGRRCWEKI